MRPNRCCEVISVFPLHELREPAHGLQGNIELLLELAADQEDEELTWGELPPAGVSVSASRQGPALVPFVKLAIRHAGCFAGLGGAEYPLVVLHE